MEYELVPPLTLGWRLKMALDMAGLSNVQMAEALGVSRATISRWMADKGAAPHRAYIKQWSEETHVGLHWLETGQVSAQPLLADNDRYSTGSVRAGLNRITFVPAMAW